MKYNIYLFIFIISIIILLYPYLYKKIKFIVHAKSNYCHRLETLIYGIDEDKKEIKIPIYIIDKNIKNFINYMHKKHNYKLIKKFIISDDYSDDNINNYLSKNNLNLSQYFDQNEHKIIYVGRKDSKRRKILNEEILIKFLKNKYKERLKILDLNDNYTILDQAKIFSNCDIFIGIHGAAIANLFFMRPNTKIIEIVADDCKPHLFNDKAKIKNINHNYLHLKDFQEAEEMHSYPRDSYMKINDNDLEKLNNLLE